MAYEKTRDRRKRPNGRNVHFMLDDDSYAQVLEVAKENHVSAAWVIRACITGALEEYRKHVVFADEETGKQVREELARVGTILSDAQVELKRAGNNLNQLTKVANSLNRYPDIKKNVDAEFDRRKVPSDRPIISKSQTDDVRKTILNAEDVISSCVDETGRWLWQL